MKSETIELVTQYKDGAEIKEKTVRVFATKKSLTRNEFYSAYGVGLRPSYIFVMHTYEFKLADVDSYSATHIRHNGKLYEIVRVYELDRFNTEITVK